MTTYILKIEVCNSDKLGTIVAALSKEGITFKVDTKVDKPNRKPRPSKVQEIILETIDIGQFAHASDVINALTQNGYKASSYSPAISRLARDNIIKRESNGFQRLK